MKKICLIFVLIIAVIIILIIYFIMNNNTTKNVQTIPNYIHVSDLLEEASENTTKTDELPNEIEIDSLFDYNDEEALYEYTDYIIVGKVESIDQQHWEADMKNTVTLGTIKIQKSFKGNLKKGEEISFIRDGGLITMLEFENSLEERNIHMLENPSNMNENLSKEEKIKKYGLDKYTEEEKNSTYVFDGYKGDIPIQNGVTYLIYLNYNEELKKYEIKYHQYGLREVDTSKIIFNYENAKVKNNNTGAYVKIKYVLSNEALQRDLFSDTIFRILSAVFI